MADPAKPRHPAAAEFIAALSERLRPALYADDPESVATARGLLAAAPDNATQDPDPAVRSAYIIGALYAGSEWSTARLELATAVTTAPLGAPSLWLLNLLRNDPALEGVQYELLHWLSDWVAADRQHPLLDAAGDVGLEILLLADNDHLMPLFGSYLAERDDLPGRIRAQGLAVASDDFFASNAFSLPEVSGVLARLGEVDLRAHIVRRSTALRLGGQLCRYLVSLRPTAPDDAEGLLWLLDTALQHTTWLPAPGEVASAAQHWLGTLPTEFPYLAALFNGLAMEAIKARNPRAAAIWSLEAFAKEPSLHAMCRAIHEACSANDHLVLMRALTAGPWNEDAVEDAHHEQLLLGLLRANMMLAYDPPSVATIRELADRCAGSPAAPTDLRVGKFGALFGTAVEGHREFGSTPHALADMEAKIFNMGFVGVELAPGKRFPYTEPRDLEACGPASRFTIAHLMTRAARSAEERRVGPLGLLQLADCAIEMGDMSVATSLIVQAEQGYPDSICVLVSRLKIAGHASRRTEIDRYAGELATALRARADSLSPHEVAHALVTLPKWFFEAEPDIGERFLSDARFSDYHALLRERLD